jgi:hypothetical protein
MSDAAEQVSDILPRIVLTNDPGGYKELGLEQLRYHPARSMRRIRKRWVLRGEGDRTSTERGMRIREWRLHIKQAPAP